WTTLDLLNGKGLEYLVRHTSPFDEALLVSPAFGWKSGDQGPIFEPLPRPGSGLLGAGDLPAGFLTQPAPHIAPQANYWGKTRIGFLGLPALYPGTPVETISLAEVRRLADALGPASSSSPPPLPPPPVFVETTVGHREEADLLGKLISRYGVSGAEGPVREEVLRQLPSWAKPEVDEYGNVLVTVGRGEEHVLFVAHMDEVGFGVAE